MTQLQTKAKPIARPLETTPRAIVVGASSGIGAALVHQLANSGYCVAAVARRTAELDAVCEQHEFAYPYVHDVTDYDAVPALFQQIASDLDGLDLIIYVAAVQPSVAPDEYNFGKDHAMMSVNVLGAMAWLNEAALRFSRARSGHIVGISSISGDRGRSAFPGYHTSKAALSTYLESLRNRLAKQGVTVTTIKPGFVDAPLLGNADKTFWVISAEEAARQIEAAINAGKQTVYVPARWGLVSLIIRHIPSFIFRRIGI
jgi:short-subunit dehydrogenase